MRGKFLKRILSIAIMLGMLLQPFSTMQTQAAQPNTSVSGDIEVIFNFAEDTMEPYIEAFCAKYPNVKVNYLCYSNFETQIVDRIEKGDYGDVLFVPAYLSNTEITSLFSYLGDYTSMSLRYNYLDGGKRINNGIYGIPAYAYISGILYNKDVFYQAGVTKTPKSAEEFLQALKDIDERTDAIPFYTNASTPWVFNVWENFSYIDMTGNPDYKYHDFIYEKDAYLEGSTHYQVYELLYNIVKNGLCEPDPMSSDWEKSKEMLNHGEIGAMAIGSWAISQVKEAGDGADAIGFLPFPHEISGRQYVTVSAEYCYGVAKNTKYPEAARAFLEFMIDESGYALDREMLSVVRTDPYPDVYGDMENALLLTEGIADTKTFSHYTKLTKNLDFEDGLEAQRVVKAAMGISGETFDEIAKDWNDRWESSRTKDMPVKERDLTVGAVTSIIQNYVINFSKTEKEFLENVGPLKVGYLTEFAPFQYETDGEFTGVSRDLCDAIMENTGLQLEYTGFANTQAMISALKAGEIDMIAGIDKVDDDDLRYSKIYTTFMNVLVKNETVGADLGVGSKLACVKGENNAFADMTGVIKRNYDSYAQAINAVENLDADYVAMNYYTADYYMTAEETNHVTMLPVSNTGGMYFVFDESVDTRLISICNKCIYGIPDENIQLLLREHLNPPVKTITLTRFIEANPFLCISVIVVIFLLIALAVAIVLSEKMKSAQKHAMDVKRYEILASIVNEYLFEYDIPTEAVKFDKKFVEKFGFEKEVLLKAGAAAGTEVEFICSQCMEVTHEEGGESEAFLLTDVAGSSQWYKVVAHTVRDADGKPQHIIAKLVNVQKEMEEKKRITDKAEKDPLTGLFNRDGFRSRMAEVYEHVEEHLPIGLVMIDFDNFKSVNDTLGHAGGDVALKMLAGNMNDLFDEGAVNCRYGGDEFMIFTYGIKEEDLEDKLRTLVQRMDYDLSYQGESQKVSISVGATCTGENVSYEKVFAVADQALYNMKENGKNGYRFIVYKDSAQE